jgi:hypothetical protein
MGMKPAVEMTTQFFFTTQTSQSINIHIIEEENGMRKNPFLGRDMLLKFIHIITLRVEGEKKDNKMATGGVQETSL